MTDESYVEPCALCSAGRHLLCDVQVVDHAFDHLVPCPCRSAGHPEEPA